MKEFRIAKLIVEFLNDKEKTKSHETLSEWITESLEHKDLVDELRSENNLRKELYDFNAVDKSTVWNQVKVKLHKQKRSFFFIRSVSRRNLKIAAVILLLCLPFFYYIFTTSSRSIDPTLVAEQDFAPGTIGGTLTLSDGSKIPLDGKMNGELAREGGAVIRKEKNGELVYEIKNSKSGTNNSNTLSTSYGQTYRVKLPDGSSVWLNAGSSLTYPTDLGQGPQRFVRLDGEAFFDIAKNPSKPFTVQAGSVNIKVLGTHFNLNAYKDEQSIVTTLVEGMIELSSGGRTIKLVPGKQAIISDGEMNLRKVDVSEFVDWKEGEFSFNDTDFKAAMRKIARWYNTELVYDTDIPDYIESSGWISRDNNLSTVLKLIEKSGQVRFKIDGDKLHIRKADNYYNPH